MYIDIYVYMYFLILMSGGAPKFSSPRERDGGFFISGLKGEILKEDLFSYGRRRRAFQIGTGTEDFKENIFLSKGRRRIISHFEPRRGRF